MTASGRTAPPAPDRIAEAVERAAAFLRAGHVGAGAPPGNLAERVVGLPGRAEDAARGADPDGWCPVGTVADGVAGEDRPVWFHPATGRVRLRRIAPPLPVPTPAPPGGYFDGTRLRWVADPDAAHPDALHPGAIDA